MPVAAPSQFIVCNTLRVAMRFGGPAMGGGFGSPQLCGLCGRDLWEVERYISAGMIKVCDRCIVDSHQVIVQAEASGEGPAVSLPARVFGEVPDDEAVGEIVTAFERAFTTDTSYVEDFAGLQSYADAAGARQHVRVSASNVNRIRFLSPEEARVQFSLTLTSGGTFPIDGLARRTGDRWQVSRETQVDLLRRGGAQIP